MNEEKLSALEEEASNALEVAEEAHEEGAKEEEGEAVSLLCKLTKVI